MQHVCTGPHPPSADVIMLPIIDLSSSDNHCIYSTLCYIEQQAKQLGIDTPCITFDQPLWLKAVEIVTASKLNIVCRLGGFHTLMSFLGSIGTLMSGSGIMDVFEACYEPNAIIHMMSGKAYARALRGHLLLEAALAVKLMNLVVSKPQHTQSSSDYIEEDDEDDGNVDVNVERITTQDVEDLNILYDVIRSDPNTVNMDELDFTPLSKLEQSLKNLRINLSSFSRTAKLWLLYMYHIDTIKMFIRAERTGNWNLHLVLLERMLNLLAATGHNNYAKSARLYLQLMHELPNTHPWLHTQFAVHGYHTVRRTDRY